MLKTPLYNPLYYIYNLYKKFRFATAGITISWYCQNLPLPPYYSSLSYIHCFQKPVFLTPHLQNRNSATPLPHKCIITVNLSIFIIYTDAKQLFPKILLPTFNLYPTSKSTTNPSRHLFKSYLQMPCSIT